MQLIEELVLFGDGLDGEGRHPAATAVGLRWGTAPPRFVRSSASHVLVADRTGRRRLVMRLRPVGQADVLERSARAALEWNAAGAPMTAAVPSLAGRLVETAHGYAAMALEVEEGPTLAELEDEIVDHAADWGEALARLHTVRLATPALPEPPDLPLPRTTDVYGTLHGDPEADNVVLGDGGLRFVDPDEVRQGWFAADVAFALRDWALPGKAPHLAEEVPRRFVAGYRRVRPLSRTELSWLPTLARESARVELMGYEKHLRVRPARDWPSWATRLDSRVRERAVLLRESLAAH